MSHVSLPVLPSANITRPLPSMASCQRCRFEDVCGGLDELQGSLFGCFSSCRAELQCGNYDWTCPCRPDFVSRWAEVGGWPPRPPVSLRACTEPTLPTYMPMVVTHGLKTRDVVPVPVAAVTTFELIKGRGKRRHVDAENAAEFREQCRLPQDSRVLLVSVGHDGRLASYWRTRLQSELPQQLANLGVLGITVPNFSFFTDAPRTHTIWNRARMLRCAEEFSTAGLSVILHLNALTNADWDYWGSLLRDHPQHRYVAKEFQTGLLDPDKSDMAIKELAVLQDKLGRELHPLIIGGPRLAAKLPGYFKHFTIIDSKPWMATIKRRLLEAKNGKIKERQHLTDKGELLDLLLSHNLEQSTERLAAAFGKKNVMPAQSDPPRADAVSRVVPAKSDKQLQFGY